MPEQVEHREELARRLFDAALLRGRFELRSGGISDHYFDKFRASSDPALLREIATGLAAFIGVPKPDRIVAPALGAVPIATALSLHTNLPVVIVRGAAKSYGTNHQVEGPCSPGDRALLIEDVVTSGSAALEALSAARDAGIVIEHAACVLERPGSGRDALQAAGVTLSALFGPDDLARALERTPSASGAQEAR